MRPISTVEIHCSEKPFWTDRGWRPVSWRHEEDPLPLPDWANSLLRCTGGGAEEEPRGKSARTRYRTVAPPWQPPGRRSALWRRCIQGCVSSFSHFLLLFLRKWFVWSPSHHTAGEWSKEGSWNKSTPHFPKSEYNSACSATKIHVSIICFDTQSRHQIKEDVGFTDLKVSTGCLSVCCGLKTLWQGDKICSFCVFYWWWGPLSIFVII